MSRNVAKLTKEAKKEIALSMIYHSIDVATFGDSFTSGTLSYEDEEEILDFIRKEHDKLLKRIKTGVHGIMNVDDMVSFFDKNK